MILAFVHKHFNNTITFPPSYMFSLNQRLSVRANIVMNFSLVKKALYNRSFNQVIYQLGAFQTDNQMQRQTDQTFRKGQELEISNGFIDIDIDLFKVITTTPLPFKCIYHIIGLIIKIAIDLDSMIICDQYCHVCVLITQMG